MLIVEKVSFERTKKNDVESNMDILLSSTSWDTRAFPAVRVRETCNIDLLNICVRYVKCFIVAFFVCLHFQLLHCRPPNHAGGTEKIDGIDAAGRLIDSDVAAVEKKCTFEINRESPEGTSLLLERIQTIVVGHCSSGLVYKNENEQFANPVNIQAVFILKVLLILAGMPLNFPLTHNAFVVTGITMEHLQMRSTGASRYN
uniref:7TM_GPCR_Srx domain-containing protein n=1 Tax=Steinernema glaseri TaxID=37863 RepID=A0A1I7YNW8_9BILA